MESIATSAYQAQITTLDKFLDQVACLVFAYPIRVCDLA
jgi:hypothetical protein